MDRLRARWTARWQRLQARRPSVRHAVKAWRLMQRNNGNLYAAAITYFSFLAIFPLLLLGVSVLAFALHSDPSLQHSLYEDVAQRFPGRVGETLHDAIQAAIENRSGVGVIGLAGVLVTGLGWIANLRAAIDAVWGLGERKLGFLRGRVSDLVVLIGLGVGSVVSLGLTAVGTALTDQILSYLDLADVPGSTLLMKLLGIVLALAGDTLIFWWLLVRLPVVTVPERVAWRGAVLAAVGFEILKIAGTYVIAHTADSPTAGPFAGLVAVLVWIQLVARWLLFACAWTATLTAEVTGAAPEPGAQVEGAADEHEEDQQPGTAELVAPAPAGVAGTGTGAAAGAGGGPLLAGAADPERGGDGGRDQPADRLGSGR